MDYVLIPGAGGRAWYWHLVGPGLVERGHQAMPVELPADDNTKGLADYAHSVLEAAGAAREVIVVAASLGAFTAAAVAEPLNAVAVVLVNPMIPVPGETPAAWWANTGAVQAREAGAARLGYPVEFDPRTYMFHDVPMAVLATVTPKGDQSQRPFGDPATFTGWPALPTVICGEDDRFFPLEFQQHLARERLGVEPTVVPGGHLVALSRPDELTAAILNATSSEEVGPPAMPTATAGPFGPNDHAAGGRGRPLRAGVGPLELSSGRHRPAHTLAHGRTAARPTSPGGVPRGGLRTRGRDRAHPWTADCRR